MGHLVVTISSYRSWFIQNMERVWRRITDYLIDVWDTQLEATPTIFVPEWYYLGVKIHLIMCDDSSSRSGKRHVPIQIKLGAEEITCIHTHTNMYTAISHHLKFPLKIIIGYDIEPQLIRNHCPFFLWSWYLFTWFWCSAKHLNISKCFWQHASVPVRSGPSNTIYNPIKCSFMFVFSFLAYRCRSYHHSATTRPGLNVGQWRRHEMHDKSLLSQSGIADIASSGSILVSLTLC